MKAVGAAAALGIGARSTSARTDAAERGDRSAAIRRDAARTGRFEVDIEGIEVGGWQRVTIPGSSTERAESREGDRWGRTTFGDLELIRASRTGDAQMWDWRQDVIEGRVDEGRKEIAITVLDEEGEPQVDWLFFEAWIREYDPPELDAGDEGAIATEAYTIAFDRMRREAV